MLKRMTMMLAASAAVFVMATGIAAAQDTLKIGASAPKTGPLAGGAAVTHWPNIKLWIEEVNKRGGLKVGGKQMKVELVEYDDKTTGDEAIKNITRLATVDKVDFIVTPYSTGINVATAPLIAQLRLSAHHHQCGDGQRAGIRQALAELVLAARYLEATRRRCRRRAEEAARLRRDRQARRARQRRRRVRPRTA